MATALLADMWGDALRVVIACCLLILAALLLGAGVWFLKRVLIQDRPSADQPGQPWTLEDLRQMRDRGDLSESEFQTMRGVIIDACQGGSSGHQRPPDSVARPARESDAEDWDWIGTDFDVKKRPPG